MKENKDKVFIIAEAGVNHNGSLLTAKKLIEVARKAGADAVKFQSFRAEEMVSNSAPKARYQKHGTDRSESQLQMLKRLELDEEGHSELIRYCAEQGIQFLSTPFDSQSLKMLSKKFAMPILKVSSGEITNAPFLLEIAQTGKQIILSTGMSTLKEVEMALGVLAFGFIGKKSKPSIQKFREAFESKEGKEKLKKRVTLLHCTSEYPAKFSDVNLKAMATLSKEFGLRVGLSDHTPGISIPAAAVALGAVVVEKHFTLDRNLPGPDHRASLIPEELRMLVQSIREIEAALGTGKKQPAEGEKDVMLVARRSVVALRDIQKGEVLDGSNLGCKRPGTGVSPLQYWNFLGKKARSNFKKDEQISL